MPDSSSTADLHPALIAKVNRVLTAMSALGFPMRICQGVRTVAQQRALYAKGRTTPGPIVTNCDGIVKMSNHQPRADGYGYAVDCCFVGADPWTGPWEVYGAAGMAVGLVWGGKFSTLTDRPHLELPSPPATSPATA
jgi:peptidoglycan L-alanyl-D-glutamate endopeptidase CwlK